MRTNKATARSKKSEIVLCIGHLTNHHVLVAAVAGGALGVEASVFRPVSSD